MISQRSLSGSRTGSAGHGHEGHKAIHELRLFLFMPDLHSALFRRLNVVSRRYPEPSVPSVQLTLPFLAGRSHREFLHQRPHIQDSGCCFCKKTTTLPPLNSPEATRVIGNPPTCLLSSLKNIPNRADLYLVARLPVLLKLQRIVLNGHMLCCYSLRCESHRWVA